MEYRKLGRTGVKVSELCLGSMMFGGRTDEVDSIEIVDQALDAGINFVDTANVYNAGRSEEVVGKALGRDGKREKTVLATKVHGVMDEGEKETRVRRGPFREGPGLILRPGPSLTLIHEGRGRGAL